MKKVYLALLLVVCIIGGNLLFSRTSTSDSSVIRVDEMTPLSLELVYEGMKPDGIGSVQSFAITPDYFVVASRPPGSEEEGGETNNRLSIIDRQSLADVTKDFAAARKSYELGHANGMAYNPETNELLIVGIHDENDECTIVARVDAANFRQKTDEQLPSGTASGIAYAGNGEYFARSGGWIHLIGNDLTERDNKFYFASGLAVQDIGYYADGVYLADWAKSTDVGTLWKLGLKANENVIYRYDVIHESMRAFLISAPRLELESVDFADGEAYVLMNGIGDRRDSFYIYRVLDDEAGKAFLAM